MLRDLAWSLLNFSPSVVGIDPIYLAFTECFLSNYSLGLIVRHTEDSGAIWKDNQGWHLQLCCHQLQDLGQVLNRLLNLKVRGSCRPDILWFVHENGYTHVSHMSVPPISGLEEVRVPYQRSTAVGLEKEFLSKCPKRVSRFLLYIGSVNWKRYGWVYE